MEQYVAKTYENTVDHSLALDYAYTPHNALEWQTDLQNYDMQKVIEALGYDPGIKVYRTDNVVNGSNTTVYVHGYGDNHSSIVPFFQICSYLVPGTVVSFDFQDVIAGTFKPNLKKSSVGQAADIASLASVLKVLDECGLDVIHLFGYSRGGATTITTLARLCQYDEHKNFFGKLDINKEQALRILKKVQAETIVLTCPLVDSRSGFD